ncbi:MAG: hypothetical protein WDZ31_09770 [Phycisphaeraceae bacterium]
MELAKVAVMNVHAIVILFFFGVVLAGCGLSSQDEGYRLTVTVINHTGHELTDVAVVGDGYPGRYGILVPTARKVFTYNTNGLADEFEVVWRDGNQQFRKTVPLPDDFEIDNGSDLVIAFSADGQVSTYTEPKSGAAGGP